MKRRSIQDRRVLLSGASSGIGQALGRQLLSQGAQVILTARRREPLAALAKEFPQSATVVTGDITQPETREALIDAATERWGALDLLINNAGVGAMGPFAQATPERLQQVLAVNFVAPAELCRRCYPLLCQGVRPAVLNIGSILGHRAVPWKSEYCASKFALRGLSSALRSEWKSSGVDVLHVSPSTTDSPFFERAIEDTMKRDWKGRSAMSPEQVARVAIRSWQSNRSDVLLTWGGKTLVWFDRLCPRWADWAITRWG